VVDAHAPARIGQPAMVVPGAMEALQALGAAIAAAGIPERTVDLVNTRASQINGCGVCLLGDLKSAKRHGETDERLAVVAGWREAPFFTARERAALAFAEDVTLVAADHVPDEVYAEVAAHYSRDEIGALVALLVTINAWNRIGVSTRTWTPEARH
jgi:AhpD family alkylhydroperoxidase